MTLKHFDCIFRYLKAFTVEEKLIGEVYNLINVPEGERNFDVPETLEGELNVEIEGVRVNVLLQAVKILLDSELVEKGLKQHLIDVAYLTLHCLNSLPQTKAFSIEETLKTFFTALIHDIGKCYIDPEILHKKETLSDEEWKEIQTHINRGQMLVNKCAFPKFMGDAAYYHHEQYGGDGYPGHFSGENIPLHIRFTTILDHFVSLVEENGRGYRQQHYAPNVAIDKIEKEESGRMIDPKLAELVLNILRIKVNSSDFRIHNSWSAMTALLQETVRNSAIKKSA